MEIRILVENTCCEGFSCEHGLSLLARYKGEDYLIDTGTTGLFADNADRMGADLSGVCAAFLSHAHYDHSGGFARFFSRNGSAKLYLQSAADNVRCYRKSDGGLKYIGLPRHFFTEYPKRFVFVRGFLDLGNGIFLLPHTTANLKKRGEHAGMYYKYGNDGALCVEEFAHEQSVVFAEADGLVVCNSCSHAGVENILREVSERFPEKRIKAFFGGFHMMGAGGMDTCSFTKEEVTRVATELARYTEVTLYSGHCTGNLAYAWLKEILGDRLAAMHSGMAVKI